MNYLYNPTKEKQAATGTFKSLEDALFAFFSPLCNLIESFQPHFSPHLAMMNSNTKIFLSLTRFLDFLLAFVCIDDVYN